MKLAARLTRFSLLLSSTVLLLWLAGCGGYVSSSRTGSAPLTPTGLAAATANAQVNLTWNTTSGATGYYVKRSTSSASETQIAAPSTTAYTDNAVTNGTKYYYLVSAYNSYGQSANSAEVSVTPAAPPPPAVPTGLAATAGNMQVALSWTASSGATSYHVKRSTTSGSEMQIAAPASANFTDTGLTNGTKYYYLVSAVNSAGESLNSAELSATPTAPITPPAVPTGLTATAGNAQVNLTWNVSAGATSYHLKRSTTAGSGYTQIGAPPTANFADSGLTNGTTYYYVVTAVNTAGESGNSNQASSTPINAAADVTITIDPAKTKPDEMQVKYREALYKARFIMDLYDTPFPFVPSAAPDLGDTKAADARFKAGEAFVTQMDCLKCHYLGDLNFPGGNNKPTAPNLALAHRLVQRADEEAARQFRRRLLHTQQRRHLLDRRSRAQNSPRA